MITGWEEVLKQTGVLSCDQLERFFSLSCEHLKGNPALTFYGDAVWDPARFGRGAHLQHRVLLAEIRLRLWPLQPRWQAPHPNHFPEPDALLYDAAAQSTLPVYLEADTGKESRRQWQDKLEGYRILRPVCRGIWVVAQGGPRRLERLRSWVDEAGLSVPHRVDPVHVVGRGLPDFPDPPPPPTEPPPRKTLDERYVWADTGSPVPTEQAILWLASGRVDIAGRELIHGELRWYLSSKTGFDKA